MIKELAVKEWFLNKKEQEKGISVNTCRVWAKLQESEKAVKVVVADTKRHLVFWCPKSCLEINEINDAKEEIKDLTNVPFYEDYNVMIEELKSEMSFYI